MGARLVGPAQQLQGLPQAVVAIRGGRVDLEQRLIRIDPPEGLLDLDLRPSPESDFDGEPRLDEAAAEARDASAGP